MNPLLLTLKGFKGIKAGLGIDEVHLDLGMAGQLIAIAGPNGAGKTTILDNLHPYRLMPSRASSYATGGFSYFDHTYGVAQKKLVWEHGGVTYESTIIIKGAGKTKTQECYLNRVSISGGVVPVSLPDGTASDGKTKTYDTLVESIIGTPEMFFTAAFSSQGRRTLADYTNGDIKSLMSELLNLDSVLALGQQANDVVRAARNQLVVLRERANDAANIEITRGAVTMALSECETALVTLTDKRDAQRAACADYARQLAEAQAGAAAQADVERRRQTLTQQAESIRKRLESDLEAHQSATKAAIAAIIRAKTSAREQARTVNAHINLTQTRIEGNQLQVAGREGVEKALAAAEQIHIELPAARAALAESEQIDAQIREAESAIETARATLNLINHAGKALQNTYDNLCARAHLVDEVPCSGTEMQGKCKLLAEAVTARAGIPANQAELEAKRAERATARAQLDAAVDARAALTAKDTAALAAKVRQLEVQERAAGGLQIRLEQIEAAQAQLIADEAALTQLMVDSNRIAGELTDADGRIEDIETDADARGAVILSNGETELSIIQAELDALPPTNTDALRAIETKASAAELLLTNIDKEIAETHAKHATLVERARHLDKEAADLVADVERARRMEDEVAQWTLLSKALGPDGIVALCIDDAGPTLTTYCNDLLSACYGPRFSVAIQTQRETKDGNLRETFDIVVYDAERGDEKSIRDVSGGERIWINECMTRAIALYQAEASGRRYGCLFADESDGALDGDKKRQYAAMKRRVLELGGYQREFFISHSPEVREAADTVIDVTDLAA